MGPIHYSPEGGGTNRGVAVAQHGARQPHGVGATVWRVCDVALVLRGGRAMWRIVHSVKVLDVRILDSG